MQADNWLLIFNCAHTFQSQKDGPLEQTALCIIIEKMSFITNIAVIFALATAVLFTASSAAPIVGDVRILPYPGSFNPGPFNPVYYQQDSVPDPGIGDWFTNIFNSLRDQTANNLKNRDPKMIEEVKNYIKKMRSIVTPVSTFIGQFYSNDVAASNIIKAINGFLSSLEKLVEEPSVSQKDLESLMKMLESLKS